ncbi:MAG: hypothetical protein IKT00_14615 [Prevotella sp.]|nr:hypothetical protein [Prevotella sp.]
MKAKYISPKTEIVEGVQLHSVMDEEASGTYGGGDAWGNKALFEEENEDGDNNQGNTESVDFTLWD